MAPWIETSDNAAPFVGSNPDSAVINGGIFRRHAHTLHSNNECQMQKRGYLFYFDKRESTANSQMLLRHSWKRRLNKRYVLVAVAVLAICAIAVIVVTALQLRSEPKQILAPPRPETTLPPWNSEERHFRKAAVCSDAAQCAEIGKKIFLMNGSVVDALVATQLCNGILMSQSMGLGGGFVMTLYLRESQTAVTLNARETAPLHSNADMYNEGSEKSMDGVMAVGVPGELKGYWEAHQRYGWLPWEEVIKPTINVCEEGYIMSKHQSDCIAERAAYIRKDPVLSKMFVNPETGEFFQYGDRVRLKELCETLKMIALHGGDYLYNGTLAKTFVSDIQQMGGIITEEDMANYRVKWEEPVRVNLRDKMTLFSTPPPGSGLLLGFILNILDGYNFTSESIKDLNSTLLTYHRISEAFKFAYARRPELGDGDFANMTDLLQTLQSNDYGIKIRQKIDDTRTYTDPTHYGAVRYSVDDHGTAHVSIIAPNGDAASITSSVNLYFGAAITSHRTGIILNSVMNDFSIPKTINYFGIPFASANIIEPGKRAVSSMCPSIIVNRDGDVRLVIGAAGGPKITTTVAIVIMRILWFGEGVKQAVDALRIYHQLFPMEVGYDPGVQDQILKGLQRFGHKTEIIKDRGAIICAVAKLGNMIIGNADFRKAGDVFGID